ncbi:MAG: Na+/H+ antiporter [Candidatus Velthaea sp.]
METPFLFAGALAATVLCAIAAKRFGLPYPIVFVVAGAALAFIPDLPAVTIDPQYIFLIVLPPLLFYGGWSTDWRLFVTNLRPIVLLAVGLVFITTVAVAVSAHAFGFGWAAAFVLGAIVSPPDAVAAGAIFERFSIPRRVAAILDGEGLVNDGTALVLYRFAVIAAVTGTFSPLGASVSFVFVALGGIAVGIAVGLAIEGLTRLLARAGMNDSLIDNLIFLLAPYVAYLSAEALGVSGVLATVAGGVFMSRRAAAIYGAETRLVGRAVWRLLSYLLNGFVFLLIGLQLRAIVGRADVAHQLLVGAVVTVVAVVVRLVWVFVATWLPRALFPGLARRDPMPHWKNIALLAWTGLRGIVSLAAALALPLRDASGAPFPYRNDIIFVTFFVIFATLVAQGLSIMPLLKWLRLDTDGESVDEREIEVRIAALQAGLARLARIEGPGSLPEEWEVIGRVRSEYEHRIDHLRSHLPGERESPASKFDHTLQDETLRAERRAIMDMRDEGRIPDDIFRRIEYDLDLAEARLS